MTSSKQIQDKAFAMPPHLAYEDIATKLLKDHYFLTALELHTELVESGKELPQLREFFSNPGNFEQHVSRPMEFGSMQRTPSQATLDSLDTARYSEDGGGDRLGSGGDVAVLEFELRKARETINALRANLTQFADDDDSGLDKTVQDKHDQRVLKPHEKRALNFLINEYLLLHDYKLTSITFSDENPDQDFEDWDDVGLIMPRPAGLVNLFRGTPNMNLSSSDVDTQTEFEIIGTECQTDSIQDICGGCQNCEDGATWNHELLIHAEEIELLKQKVIALETEKLNFQKLYDAAIVSLNSLTSPASEKALELKIPEERIQLAETKLVNVDNQPLPCTATENHYGSSNSTHSATPEQFEIIDHEKTGISTKKENSVASSLGAAVDSGRTSPLRRGSATTLDDALSINDGGDWTRLHYYQLDSGAKEMWIDSNLPNSLKVSILNWCSEALDTTEPLANDLLTELINNDKPITLLEFLTLVAETLPRIVPHTLVSRRCEAAALLAGAVHLLGGAGGSQPQRARLLHTLLTLLKKPDSNETRVICEAVCLVAKWGGSGEVLSSIAELLTSRSSERRILASQICVSVAPYVPIELCTSLLLSLVILMCESNELEVRSLGLKAACLVCPVAEHKYGQLESIMLGFLKDSVVNNVKDTVRVFVPVLARAALVGGKFSTDLYKKVLTNLEKASTDQDWKTMLLYLDILKVLVIPTLVYVVNVQTILNNSNCDMVMNYQEVLLESDKEEFLNVQCYVTDNLDVKTMVVNMNKIIKEKPNVRWNELEWFIQLLKQLLDIFINSKILNHTRIYDQIISLYNSYVENFGPEFTTKIFKPMLLEVISGLEQKMDKLDAIDVDSAIVVGIYLVTVLPAGKDFGSNETGKFLQKWVMYSSLRGVPVKVMAIPLRWLAAHNCKVFNLYMEQLKDFTITSRESPNGTAIRVFAANLISELMDSAVSSKTTQNCVLPVVVELLEDQDGTVRESAIEAWGALWHGITGEEGEEAGHAVWGAARWRGGGREAARWAHVTALTAARTDTALLQHAISFLCSLCSNAPLTNETMAALVPALQLVSHRAPAHPGLLPVLRKVEESVQSPPLSQYKPAIEVLIHNVVGPTTPETSKEQPQKQANPNILAAQEVGRRVTQMFQQSKTNMNLPNIFKKKS